MDHHNHDFKWGFADHLIIILLFVKPLGWDMARVYKGKPCGLEWIRLDSQAF
jgi:hypothetical protein